MTNKTESYWEQARRKFKKTDQKGSGLIGTIVSLLAGLLLTILALRLVFRLLGANPANGLVDWVYSASRPFVEPFYGIFSNDITVTTGRFEIETLIALIVYGVIASLIIRLVLVPRRHRTI